MTKLTVFARMKMHPIFSAVKNGNKCVLHSSEYSNKAGKRNFTGNWRFGKSFQYRIFRLMKVILFLFLISSTVSGTNRKRSIFHRTNSICGPSLDNSGEEPFRSKFIALHIESHIFAYLAPFSYKMQKTLKNSIFTNFH